MDSTLLIAIAVAVALLTLCGGYLMTRGGSGRFAFAGGAKSRPSAAPAAPGPAPAVARSFSLTASDILDLPAAAPASPFAPPPPAHSEVAVERLQARMDARFDALERDIRTRLEALAREIAVNRDTATANAAAIDARQTAFLRDVRAELDPLLTRPAATDRLPLLLDKRAEASAELYALVARLESAISQVTNPVLLPGEAYAPPIDFLAEALAWENWKEVGERAFALADAFSARRLFLTEEAACAVAAFITTLRGVLTRSVYPNLAPDATSQQIDSLRSAMASLAAEIPRVRKSLETEFRSVSAEAAAAS
ncbi:MAG: hypothetical protein ACR2J8_11635 [Thermomicrobiales bacterium]